MAQNGWSQNGPSRASRDRAIVLYAIPVVLFALTLFHYWYLQVIQGKTYLEKSISNQVREWPIQAQRGMILDRNGKLLVDSRPFYEAVVTPEDMENTSLTLSYLEVLLGIDRSKMEELIRAGKRRRAFEPILLKSGLTFEELSLLESFNYEIPGVSITHRPVRDYFFGPMAANLLGYMGEISETELRMDAYKDKYRQGDLIGKYGLESRLEEPLRGINGTRWVEVDAHGRELRDLKVEPPTPGLNVVLTLDTDLQQAAEDAFVGKNGALVAMDPRTGEILAWVSEPAFDPNLFSGGIPAEEWKRLNGDPNKPLMNRAIQGQYPPGSTFKIVMTVAALAEGVVTPDTAVFCPGFYSFQNRDYRCWKKGGHGSVALHRAIVESCDTYFYHVGHLLGIDRIAKYARLLGLGGPTGVLLSHEKKGLIPSSSWKEQVMGVQWFAGETLSCSIGQGYVLVTPLQQAVTLSTVINGGTVFRPWFVKRWESLSGRPVEEFGSEERGKLPVSKANLDFLRDALVGAVNEPHGTGSAAKLPGILVGGKTGTAQVRKLGAERTKVEHMAYEERDHAWFVSYAPAEAPEIVVVVLNEHGGHGGSAAAPVAQAVLQAYFRKTGRLPNGQTTVSAQL